MRLALDEARTAPVHGDVPIGAVVLDAQGAVVGRGANARELASDPTAHAEVLALRQAAAARGEWRLSGCTLVVTLEPCTMCAGAASLARVDRVVFGAWNPELGRCRVVVGPAARPAAQPPTRGGRWGPRGGLLGAARGVVRRPAGGRSCRRLGFLTDPVAPVPSSAVACPSGRRSTPRKRVRGQPLRGFKSHRHRHSISTTPADPPWFGWRCRLRPRAARPGPCGQRSGAGGRSLR